MAEAAPPPAKRARLAALASRPDRILVPHEQEQQHQPPGQAAGFRVTAAEFDGLQTLAEMPEHEPGTTPRYTVMLSEADLRHGLGLLRGGAEFVAALDLETLVRAVAACDFLGAAALPATAAVLARLLPGAGAAAEEEAKEVFFNVMERTSFGPALWAEVPLEQVGRMQGHAVRQEVEGDEADGGGVVVVVVVGGRRRRRRRRRRREASGGVGEEEQEGDAHVQGVAGMAQAELARRILALPDLELAMLRAHATAPVAVAKLEQ